MRSGSQQAESAEPAADRVGTLISVNVGMPKDVPWQGKTVVTGVFKDPVAGPRRVRKLNVDGDPGPGFPTVPQRAPPAAR